MAPKNDKQKQKISETSSSSPFNSTFPIVPYEEIVEITDGFSDQINKSGNDQTGNTAKVYKGWWAAKNEMVAVKVYIRRNLKLAKNELEGYEAFGRCPNIVSLLGICFENDSHFVLKYLPHRLDKLLETESTLKWPDTLNILLQLARAIRSVTEKEYVVADIKPDDILLDENYNLYLCDFGSAKKYGEDLPTINDQYAAREAIIGKGPTGERPTGKADVFSFGVILLQMVMKKNDIGTVHRSQGANEQVKNETNGRSSKQMRKEKNASNVKTAHISVEARKNQRIVHQILRNSGCDAEVAEAIRGLGIACTEDHPNARPNIQGIVTQLQNMQEMLLR